MPIENYLRSSFRAGALCIDPLPPLSFSCKMHAHLVFWCVLFQDANTRDGFYDASPIFLDCTNTTSDIISTSDYFSQYKTLPDSPLPSSCHGNTLFQAQSSNLIEPLPPLDTTINVASSQLSRDPPDSSTLMYPLFQPHLPAPTHQVITGHHPHYANAILIGLQMLVLDHQSTCATQGIFTNFDDEIPSTKYGFGTDFQLPFVPNPFSGFASVDAVTFRVNDVKYLTDKIQEYKVSLEYSSFFTRFLWG